MSVYLIINVIKSLQSQWRAALEHNLNRLAFTSCDPANKTILLKIPPLLCQALNTIDLLGVNLFIIFGMYINYSYIVFSHSK